MTRPLATRQNVPLLAGIAGPSGGGKTLSALKIAKGMSGGKPFAAIDTESGRMLHYADDFDFYHYDLEPPYSPQRYWDKIAEAAEDNPPVIVVDSFSHEHAGEGGVLDMHEAELTRMAGDDWKKREAMKFAAWVKPKAEHKRLIQRLLQMRTHLIVCLRAEEKIDLVKEDGKLKVVPKKTLAGHVGWIPVCGKDLPFELALSLVVTPDAPGVPKPIKLMQQHASMVPLDQPLSEQVGRALAGWAAGAVTGEGGVKESSPARRSADVTSEAERGHVELASSTSPPAATASDEPAALEAELLAWADTHNRPDVAQAVGLKRAALGGTAQHLTWLRRQVAKIKVPA